MSTMYIRICKNCSKEFKVELSAIKKGNGKFCSCDCCSLYRNTRVTIVCKTCSKEFKVRKYRKDIAKFCSHDCHSKSINSKVKCICSACGKEYHVKKGRVKETKFCGLKCSGNEYNKVICNCLKCGKEFKVKPSMIKNGQGKFCSRDCHSLHEDTKVTIACKTCGKEFKVKIGYSSKAKFCSRECAGLEKSDIKRICNCGKEFTVAKWQIKDNRSKFCSRECRWKYGKSPNWMGGITPESKIRLSKIEWRELSIDIRKRDNYICQCCNKEKSYDVHHKIPWRISKDNSFNNLITLCKSCHMKADHKYNKYGIVI